MTNHPEQRTVVLSGQEYQLFLTDVRFNTMVNMIANWALKDGYEIHGLPSALDWCERVNWGDNRAESGVDSLIRVMARELLIGGYSFIELLDNLTIAHVPLKVLWRFKLDGSKLTELWQYPHLNPKPLTPKHFVMFAMPETASTVDDLQNALAVGIKELVRRAIGQKVTVSFP